ncbi:hypothetical protein LCGC14_1370100 [marine sediment metagenome]|uniref:DUF551 domain-containing protein n=1 Tax=marine sediment metagenome TaxID=412755 RepID=A0A0F9N7L9_9ZZZZ
MSESRVVRALEKEVDKLNERIKELEAELEKHRWIPVSERLPSLKDACRGQGERGCRDGTVDVIGIDEYGHVFGANYFPKMNIWNFGTEPTHWKPIILP